MQWISSSLLDVSITKQLFLFRKAFLSRIFLNFVSSWNRFFITNVILILSLIRAASNVKHIKFKKCKALKIESNKELMLIAWHPLRWWNFCMTEDEKKVIETIFTKGL